MFLLLSIQAWETSGPRQRHNLQSVCFTQCHHARGVTYRKLSTKSKLLFQSNLFLKKSTYNTQQSYGVNSRFRKSGLIPNQSRPDQAMASRTNGQIVLLQTVLPFSIILQYKICRVHGYGTCDMMSSCPKKNISDSKGLAQGNLFY